MGNIIGIRGLNDENNGTCCGYEGIDIETGKRRYFTNMDEFGNYQDSILYEFDLNNPNTEYLRNALKNCYFQRCKFSEELPECIKRITEFYIEKHRNYNIKNGFPVDILDFNIPNLLITYEFDLFSFFDAAASGAYNGIKNSITLNVDKDRWAELNNFKKRKYNCILAHEIGHLKTSRLLIDEKEETIIQKTGVSNIIYAVKRTITKSGDAFWSPIVSDKNMRNERSVILEEILNDYDCSKLERGFEINYPNFGMALNELCDNNLLMGRYTDGMDIYYSYLTSLIESDYLANELLDIFLEITKYEGKKARYYEKEARKLIREYQKVKKGKLK